MAGHVRAVCSAPTTAKGVVVRGQPLLRKENRLKQAQLNSYPGARKLPEKLDKRGPLNEICNPAREPSLLSSSMSGETPSNNDASS